MGLEKRRVQSKIHVTFSIPEDVNRQLHRIVPKRGLSEFVTKALEAALEEATSSLKKAYAAAEQDLDRKKTIEEWSDLEIEDWND